MSAFQLVSVVSIPPLFSWEKEINKIRTLLTHYFSWPYAVRVLERPLGERVSSIV